MSIIITDANTKVINIKRIIADLYNGLVGLEMDKHLYNGDNEFLILKMRNKIRTLEAEIKDK